MSSPSLSVHASIRIRTTPQRVLDAFIQHEHLQGWWGVERSLVQPRMGGVYALTWGSSDAGFRYISSGIIDIYRSGEVLRVRDLVYYNPERPLLGPIGIGITKPCETRGRRRYSCSGNFWRRTSRIANFGLLIADYRGDLG